MGLGKFATSINCIDGRVQTPISNWIKRKYFVDYVDVITHPGSDKVMAEKNIDDIVAIKYKVAISINVHNSKLVVVSGHHDCAANISSKDKHLIQIQKSINIVKSWRLPISVIGLWVNDQWEIEQVQE